jgi:hypothetical protein
MQALRFLIVSIGLLAYTGSAFCWTPPANVDPDVVVNEAFSDAVHGKLMDAAQKHVWYHQNAVRLKPETVQVRLTVVLEEWVKLARRYPPAMQDLLLMRDLATKRVIAADGDIVEPFTEVVRINELLGDANSTRLMYAELGKRDETLAARFWLFALPALAETQDHATALRYLQVNEVMQSIEAQLVEFRSSPELNTEQKAALEAQATRHIDLTVARIVWVLMKAGRPDVAQDVARRGRDILQHGGNTPLIDAALRGDALPAAIS